MLEYEKSVSLGVCEHREYRIAPTVPNPHRLGKEIKRKKKTAQVSTSTSRTYELASPGSPRESD